MLLKEGAKGPRAWGRAKSEGSSVQPWRGRRPRDTRAPGERKRGAGRADRQAVSTLVAAASPAGEPRPSESWAEAGLSPLVDCRPHFSQPPPHLLGSQDGVLSLAWGGGAQSCLLPLAPRDAVEGF